MTPPTLPITLQNHTQSRVFAYITGRDTNNNWTLLTSTGGFYHPTSPATILQPLQEDCSIPLGPLGSVGPPGSSNSQGSPGSQSSPSSSLTVTIPHLSGGRIWFSLEQPLIFLLNPGPALVEPSVTNPTDANYNTKWHFCEFTFNQDQLFANISYVDFVCLPIGLVLKNGRGECACVRGHGEGGLERVAAGLEAQQVRDGAGWDRLVVRRGGEVLRVLSPNNAAVLDPVVLRDYWAGYVDEVWDGYRDRLLTVNTQAAAGHVQGKVVGDGFVFPQGTFSKPSSRDIFGCSSGPFMPAGSPDVLAIIPRLAAAVNRSTLHSHDFQPHVDAVSSYYGHDITNHYARIVHEVNLDGRGYAFPYDDVVPDGGQDVAGTLFDGDPVLLTVTVGGGNG